MSVDRSAPTLADSPGRVLEPGDLVAEFRLEARMGQHGPGVEWVAVQDRPRRQVALVTVPTHNLSDEARDRFHHTAELLGQLLHPGIPRVYAAGADGGHLYLALEPVEGTPLIQQAPARSRRVQLLAELCDALQHAHLRGVLHRNIRPDVIVIDGQGQPRLLDTGLARALDTDTGLSTPYTSPEQREGQPPDVRSDVYALAMVGFEWLTGARPSPDRPGLSTHTPDLDAIFARATHPDPHQRYASADDLSADLRRFLAHTPVRARTAGAGHRARLWIRRNRPLSLAFAALAVSLVAVSVGATWSTTRVQAALASEQAMRLEVEQAQQRSEAQRKAAEAVTEFFLDVLEQADPDNAVGREITVREAVTQAAREVNDGSLADSPVVDIHVRQSLMSTLFALDETTLGMAVGEELVDKLDTGPITEELLYGTVVVAHRWYKTHRLQESLRLLDRVEAQMAAHPTSNPKRRRKARGYLHQVRGRVHFYEGRYADGLVETERSAALFDGTSMEATGWNQMGDAMLRVGRLDEAEAWYRRTYDKDLAMFGPDHPQQASNLLRLGRVAFMDGRPDDGVEWMEQAYVIREATLGPDHGRTRRARQEACYFLMLSAQDDRLAGCLTHAGAVGTEPRLDTTRVALALHQGDVDGAAAHLSTVSGSSMLQRFVRRCLAAELQALRGDVAGAVATLRALDQETAALGAAPTSYIRFRIHHTLGVLDG